VVVFDPLSESSSVTVDVASDSVGESVLLSASLLSAWSLSWAMVVEPDPTTVVVGFLETVVVVAELATVVVGLAAAVVVVWGSGMVGGIVTGGAVVGGGAVVVTVGALKEIRADLSSERSPECPLTALVLTSQTLRVQSIAPNRATTRIAFAEKLPLASVVTLRSPTELQVWSSPELAMHCMTKSWVFAGKPEPVTDTNAPLGLSPDEGETRMVASALAGLAKLKSAATARLPAMSRRVCIEGKGNLTSPFCKVL